MHLCPFSMFVTPRVPLAAALRSRQLLLDCIASDIVCHGPTREFYTVYEDRWGAGNA
jgi:hypothetical protein